MSHLSRLLLASSLGLLSRRVPTGGYVVKVEEVHARGADGDESRGNEGAARQPLAAHDPREGEGDEEARRRLREGALPRFPLAQAGHAEGDEGGAETAAESETLGAAGDDEAGEAEEGDEEPPREGEAEVVHGEDGKEEGSRALRTRRRFGGPVGLGAKARRVAAGEVRAGGAGDESVGPGARSERRVRLASEPALRARCHPSDATAGARFSRRVDAAEPASRSLEGVRRSCGVRPMKSADRRADGDARRGHAPLGVARSARGAHARMPKSFASRHANRRACNGGVDQSETSCSGRIAGSREPAARGDSPQSPTAAFSSTVPVRKKICSRLIKHVM